MQQITTLELTRDCEAVQIPIGTIVILPAGTSVDLTQSLGGSHTVRAAEGLFRIAARDADALGLKTEAAPPDKPAVRNAAAVNEQQVWDALKTCFDPEIPVNIVDLGLVYDLHLAPLPSGNSRVDVKMTLTAPGCGMGAHIAADAREKLLLLDGIEEADVQVVWDPPWHQSMISSEGRQVLGLE